MLLTVEDVAKQLRIAKFTVYELIKRGELPSSKVGKQVRISQEDIENYLKKTRTGPRFDDAGRKSAVDVLGEPEPGPASAPGFPAGPPGRAIIISGQDRCIDFLLARMTEAGETPYRSFMGCYNGLNALYLDRVTMAAAHLWDAETGEYNYPFIRRLLPGMPVGVLRLAGRMEGFYVKKGNPWGIHGWEDLARPDITLINREKGSGVRILLDQKLRIMGIHPGTVKGYTREATNHVICAGIVAQSGADIGCGCQAGTERIADLDFIPLQLEWYDLVFRLMDKNSPAVEAVITYVCSDAFKRDLAMLGWYDVSQTGFYREF
jgi:putative molybdopterin biosynthesis protein